MNCHHILNTTANDKQILLWRRDYKHSTFFSNKWYGNKGWHNAVNMLNAHAFNTYFNLYPYMSLEY